MANFYLGDIALTRIVELESLPWPTQIMLPDCDPEALEKAAPWLSPTHYDRADRTFKVGYHTWLVQADGYTLLVDTCVGNCKSRPGLSAFDNLKTDYLENLARAGVRPEDVDYVLLTHLHPDHVGWNTRKVDGKWVPSFPNAKFIVSKIELEYWDPARNSEIDPIQSAVFEDSVRPIADAGLVVTFDDHFALNEDFSIRLAPGHSPGHCVIVARSGDSSALFCGDILATPAQVIFPDWNDPFCTDNDMARRTRRSVLEECADQGHLLVPAHWARPHLAWIVRDGVGFVPHFINKATPEGCPGKPSVPLPG